MPIDSASRCSLSCSWKSAISHPDFCWLRIPPADRASRVQQIAWLFCAPLEIIGGIKGTTMAGPCESTMGARLRTQDIFCVQLCGVGAIEPIIFRSERSTGPPRLPSALWKNPGRNLSPQVLMRANAGAVVVSVPSPILSHTRYCPCRCSCPHRLLGPHIVSYAHSGCVSHVWSRKSRFCGRE